ncbi:MAG: hypothetical protein PHI66_02385 [Candidatus Pacebacteria bacterium]|nr:hypothetical protein [Candidatus Paceibacterota bacterium]
MYYNVSAFKEITERVKQKREHIILSNTPPCKKGTERICTSCIIDIPNEISPEIRTSIIALGNNPETFIKEMEKKRKSFESEIGSFSLTEALRRVRGKRYFSVER